MFDAALFWGMFTDEFYRNLPLLISLLFSIALAHAVVWLLWCRFAPQPGYSVEQYAAEVAEKRFNAISGWIWGSYAFLSGGVSEWYPLYCAYRALVGHYMPYVYLTYQPIPFPLYFFFQH
jgi:hypothetical protein